MRPAPISSRVEIPEPLNFSALFDREFSYVWTTLRRLGVGERDLEDMTHEVFLQVYRRWHAYDSARPLRPWLFGFAHRMAADYRRLARHRISLVGDVAALDVAAEGAAGAEAELVERETVALVFRALEQLDFDQRAVLVLHDLDGVQMREAAVALSIPINTAYSRLRLARARFATAVRRLQRKEERKR